MSDIEEVKIKFGQQAEGIISTGLGLQKVGGKYRCPNVQGHRNGDKNPSMAWDSKALQFFCFGCGHKIDIYGYYREHLNFGHREIISELLGVEDVKSSRIQKSRDSFDEQLKEIKPLSSECMAYVKLRGLNQKTADFFNLRTFRGAIAFPYFKYGKIVGYKTRLPVKKPDGPKMRSITGSKPYLFNSDNVDSGGLELVICEGEFDCMVIWQSGIENVVSVGAGANSLNSMIEQAREYLDSFDSLIIVSDNDEAGAGMDKAFVDAFGEKVKLIDKKLYVKKDINEEFIVNGASKVVDLVESARLRIEGRRDLERTPYKGLGSKTGKYIPTGIPALDEAMNDLAPGMVTLLTGRSNGGKTTFVKQIVAKAIDEKAKVYLMNGENDPEFLLNELYQIAIGNDKNAYDLIRINKRYRKEPKPSVLEKLKEWHRKKLFMFNKGESKLKTLEGLLGMIETEIKYNQYDLVIVDNLMSILSLRASDKNEQQGDFMQGLCDLAKLYSTHVILVLHPNKTYTKGSDMDFEQIAGTSDLYNKADNIITVIREYDLEKLAEGIDGYIALIKNRYYGELVRLESVYDKGRGVLLEKSDVGMSEYNFNWRGLDVQKSQIGFEVETPPDCPF